MQLFRRSNSVGLTLIIAFLSVVIGWQAGHYDLSLSWKNYRPEVKAINQLPPSDSQTIDFSLFWQTWDLVSKKYVDKKAIDPQKMYYGAIQGMVAALGDPYTVFLPPEQQKATEEELGGSFDGVGVQLGYNKDKRLVVIAPLQGTPAEQAGLKPGDIIVKINSRDSNSLSLPEAVNMIRGPKGTTIDLEIYHEGDDKTKLITLKRDTIVVKSVEYQDKLSPQGKKIGYLKLSRFGEKTDDEWSAAVSQALASGVEGVVLDLRNNPGGFLKSARYIGSEFLNLGQDVVLQEDSRGRESYKVNRQGKLLEIPLVVLINKGSASASEIVAGAIQDYKRGKLVGEQSFGKGTIQESDNLPNNTGIHITTAKWLTPAGRWIHSIGLTPDVKVGAGTDASRDPQLEKALELFDSR